MMKLKVGIKIQLKKIIMKQFNFLKKFLKELFKL